MQTRNKGAARRRRLLATTALLSLALLPLAPRGADAQTVWDGSSSSDWNDGANWDTNAVPTAAEKVDILTNSPNATAIDGFAAVSDSVSIDTGGELSIVNAGSLTSTLGVAVGLVGQGTLTVTNGGTLTSDTSYLGFNSGSSGTATVGAGSTWTNTGELYVGGDGQGTLLVQNGGAVTASDNVYLGNGATGVGTATVDGAGSTWTADLMYVGNNGQGSLSIQNGGAVTGLDVYIGSSATGVGTATVDGAGSTWTAAEMRVGNNGQGTLTIQNGGTVTSGNAYIGDNPTGVGTATVDGAGSAWAVTPQLRVGYLGQGTLTIQNGGAVTAGNAGAGDGVVIGWGATGVGTVTVDGPGSSLASTADRVVVGRLGQGALNVTNGGTVTSGDDVLLGSVAGGVGTATVDGAGSSLAAADNLYVGDAGQGTLTIQNGGAVSAGINVYLGYEATGVGTATVDGAGSTLTAGSGLVVGENGQGTLNIINGGAVTSFGGVLGAASGSSGAATVAGAGSTWTAAVGEMRIGDNGHGTLTIQNGGAVTAAESISLGGGATGVGMVTVDGAGSSLTSSGVALYVGDNGQGTLNVTNGGAVTSSRGAIGAFSGSSGTATIDGAGSTWTVVTSWLRVGGEGQGTLTIQNGGAVTAAGDVTLGDDPTGVGTATVDGAGSILTANADVFVGDDGQGTLTIRNGGAVTAGTVVIANNAGSAGTLNIGSGGAAGTLNAALVAFGAGNGTLNFNHTDTNYTFAPDIVSDVAGLGAINHLAGVTLLTGDSSDFSGTTSVTGGGLYVNGMLGGTTNVTGGTLGGTGTLTGPLTVGAGGNVAPGNPGNSIGTLTVAAATFNAGSTYTVKLDDAGNAAGVNNGLLNATGAVTINGGTVHVTPANGTDTGTTYAVGTVYTIVTAAGGVSGTFAALTDDYAFLDFTASYDANNVFLTSQMGAASFCLPGMTANQCAAGNGVFSLGAGTLYTAVLNLSNAEAPFALDQLSGEIHASAQSALIEDSRFVREAALNRVRSAFDGVAAGPMAAFAYAPGGLQPAAADTDRFAIWGHAFGAFGHFDTDGNAARLGRSIGGLFIGGDTAVGDHWRIGALGGYSRSRFDVDALASSGTSDNYHLGVYGGGEWGAFGFRYGGAYAWHDLHTSRNVAFSGFADKLAASYRAGTGQVFGEVGYRLRAGGVRYEPFANLAYVNLHTDGFTETGGAAALVAASRSTDTAFTTLGVRAQTSLFASSGETTLRGTLGWRHAYGDVVPTSAMTFAAGGDAFLIAGVPIARNALVFDAGLDIKLKPAATLGVSYSGQFGSGVTDQGMKANLAVKF